MIILNEEYNPATGMTTRTVLKGNGQIVVQGLQDAEPILRHNQAQLNMKSAKASKLNRDGALGTKIASIPMGLIDQLAQQKGINLLTCSDAQLKRLLNDPEYRKLRTAHGKV